MATQNTAISEFEFFKKFLNQNQNHPTIDMDVDPNNISKFTRYDELLNTLRNIIISQPEKLKFFLDELSNPFLEKVYKYDNKSIYKRNNFFDNEGKFVQFKNDMIMYPVNDFGNYSEDSFRVNVYIDGRKIYEPDYTLRSTMDGKRLYIKDSKINDGSEVIFEVARIYKNKNNNFKIIRNPLHLLLSDIKFDIDIEDKIHRIQYTFINTPKMFSIPVNKFHYENGLIVPELSAGLNNEFVMDIKDNVFTIEFLNEFRPDKNDYLMSPLVVKVRDNNDNNYNLISDLTLKETQLDKYTYEVPISFVGNRHYTLSNYSLLLRKKGYDYFKNLKNGIDYTIDYADETKSSLLVTVNKSLQIRLGEYDILALCNKLSYNKIVTQVNVAVPEIKLCLEDNVNSFSIPIPFDNENELDVWLNGYHLTPGINYEINFNSNDLNMPPTLNFTLPVPRNSTVEIEFNGEFNNKYNYHVEADKMDSYGVITLPSKDLPLSQNYTSFYLDNRRLNKNDVEIIGDSMFHIKNATSLQNLYVKSSIPEYALIEELLNIYKTNKSEIGKFIDAIGITKFKEMYLLENDVEEVAVERPSLNSISLQASKLLTFKNYSDVTFRVIATYSDSTSKDVTAGSFVSTFDTTTIGIKTVTASYVENGVVVTAESEITVIDYTDVKDLFAIKIYTDKELVNDYRGRDMNIKVICQYTNGEVVDVTGKSTIRLVPQDWFLKITAEFTDSETNARSTDEKLVRVKQIVPADLDSIILSSDKNEIYSDEEIEFTVIAKYNDESYRNVTSKAVIFPIDRDKFEVQTITATYTEEGIATSSAIEIKVKRGLTNGSVQGIQKPIFRNAKDNISYSIHVDDYNIESKMIKFPYDVSNAIISFNGLFINYSQVTKDTIYLPTSVNFDSTHIENGGLQVIEWDKINKDPVLYAVGNRQNYMVFGQAIPKDGLMFYKGIYVEYDINPINNKEAKLRHIDAQYYIDFNKVQLITFSSTTGSPAKVGRDSGIVDNISKRVMFAQDVTDFLVFYNGYRHSYEIIPTKTSDITYKNSDLSFVSGGAKVVAMAIYTGLTPVGQYTDKRLEDIDKQLQRSYDRSVRSFEDFVDIPVNGQRVFELAHVPVDNEVSVFVNGVKYLAQDKNSKNWLLSRADKKFIWTYTPENYNDGFELETDFDLVIVYDYIYEQEVIE